MTTINSVYVGLSGQTGTGNFVGANTPTITTPKIITGILDTNGNNLLSITAAGSAVNYIGISNNSAGNSPGFAATGSDTNIIFSLMGKGTGGVQIHGTGTNDNAGSGDVGEFVSATLAVGSGVSLVSTTNKDVLSISLTAGDWDVWGNVLFTNSSTLITNCYGWTSSTSATAPDTSLVNGLFIAAGGIAQIGVQTPYKRYNLTTTTTIYLSGVCTFTGTTTAAGGIFARRAR